MKLEGLDLDQARNFISDLYRQISDNRENRTAIKASCDIRSIYLSNKLSVPPVIQATVTMEKIEPVELSEKDSCCYQFALKIFLKMKHEHSDYRFLLPENWKDSIQKEVQNSSEGSTITIYTNGLS